MASLRAATIPPSQDVERLIASCDLTKPHGIRDRAILLLLARLGLRAGDVLTMRLDDIAWDEGTFRVRGKGRREIRLPLPQDAGDALLKYLSLARPSVAHEQVFLRSSAPYRPFKTSCAISDVVRLALKRAGIADAPSRGANLLRHSAATGMLRAGASLDAIGTDVTEDGLIVRETKFQKSRLLPLHETTRRALNAYLAARSQLATPDRALFVSNTGIAPAYPTVITIFLQLARSIGLRAGPGEPGPRIHDLRHTFAIRSLERCPHEREAVAQHIVALSTYLGHGHVTDTYLYLQATPFLMRQIAEAGEAHHQGGAA